MSTIEERVVSMKFQGEQFLAGIDKSLAKLTQFNDKLKQTEGAKGLDNIGAAAGRQSGALEKVAAGVQHISDRFKTMGVVGIAALTGITNQAVFAGERMIKSLTMDPILDGFHEYETNMNSIQTILSNTQAAGTKLSDVTGVLDELNHYSDQTIYNFSEMAKNIGTFTAAGVGLKPAAQAIKGIANLAALSGSNSEQASGAMYQLSQAISAGRVSLEDWNSVVNAGLGGTVFQRALAQNAEKLGTLSKGAVKLSGDMKNVTVQGKSFRESITAKPGQESWLTSKVLTQTLAQFTGDLSNAQLKAEGFNATQIKNIQAQAKAAKEAATQVKTLTQLYGTIKESVGSGYAQTFKLIFGDFNEAKGLFTGLNNAIGKVVSNSANSRNKIIGDWKDLGGRTAIIQFLNNSVAALGSVIKPIAGAFREIFPAKTGAQWASMSKQLANFTATLKLSSTTATNVRKTFAGVFAIFGIGYDVLKKVITLFVHLGEAIFDGSGGFLEATGRIGDFLVNLRQAIKDGQGLNKFFAGLEKVLLVPIHAIQAVAHALGSLFDGFGTNNVIGDQVDKLTSKLSPLGHLGTIIAKGWGVLLTVIGNVAKKFTIFGNWVTQHFGGIASQISGLFSDINFDDVTKAINTGIFGAIAIMFKKFLGGGGGGGFLDNINEAIEGLTGALSGMQHALNAAAILAIAAAVGILAIAMNVMAKIDAAGLVRGTAAMAGLFIQLTAAMILLTKFTTFKGAAKLPFIAASMILMAGAVAILASAMAKLSVLDWESIAKGLVAVGGLMAIMVVTVSTMPKGPSLILTAAGLVIMAAAIKILASAVGTLGGMSWSDMIRGLTGVLVLMTALSVFANTSQLNVKGIVSGIVVTLMAKAIQTLAKAVKDIAQLSWGEMARGLTITGIALGLLAGSLKLLPPSTLLSAAGIFIVASSLKLINDALAQAGGMSWGEIAKGLVVLAGSLGLIAVGLNLMVGTLPGAAALLVAAISLQMLGKTLSDMGGMGWEEIGKAGTVLAGALLIIAGGLALMVEALPGAAALIVAAAALAIMTPVLTTLGAMSWQAIVTGLLALAGVFAVLGIAAAVLTPVIPSMLALAVSVAAIGVAMLAAGAGVALFGIGILALSAGLAALAVSGVAGTTALVGMLGVILGAVPAIVKIIGALLVALLQLVIDAAPKIGQAFNALMDVILQVIVKYIPKIIDVAGKLMVALYNAAAKYIPQMADAGQRLVTALLNGLAKRLPGIITAATNLIVAFLNAIGKNAPRIQDAGVKMIISFVNGTANAIRNNTGAMRAAGVNLATAIIDGMTGGLLSGASRVISAAAGMAGKALSAAKNVLGIHSPSKEFEAVGKFVVEGFRKGIDGNKGQIDSAFKDLTTKISALYKSAGDDVVILTKKLAKLKDARHEDKKAIKETTAALKEAKKEKAEAAAAQKYLKSLNDEHSALGKLATKYDQVTAKLKTAQETYANAVKTRDDYNKSISDQYGDVATPTGDETATDFIAKLQKQVDDTKKFSNEMQLLRKQGLNDETYKDLLAQGIDALPFVDNLLKGGKSQIDQINALNKQLDSVASSMGTNTSNALYQAAVNSAAGLVKGLQAQQKNIEAQMDKIADALVKSIKKKLGIKSPSRVFAEIGKFTALGLAEGLDKHSTVAADAAAGVGEKAAAAMRLSMANVNKMVAGNIDVQPTIRPVLDLTDIQKNAGKISDLLPTNRKMTIDSSTSTASSVAAAVLAVRGRDDPSGAGGAAGALVHYTQNNYSPKALSAVDIYRGTKNQLSTVKGALKT